MSHAAVIAIDFDGTLVTVNADGEYEPIAGAREALEDLRDRGVKVVIHTCRTGLASRNHTLRLELDFIAAKLNEFGIPFDEIYAGEKLVADFYVDDRSIGFRGDWAQTLIDLDAASNVVKAEDMP